MSQGKTKKPKSKVPQTKKPKSKVPQTKKPKSKVPQTKKSKSKRPLHISAASVAPPLLSPNGLPEYKNYCSNNGVTLNQRGMVLRNNVLDNCRVSAVHGGRGSPDARPCYDNITESEAFKRYEALGRCLAYRDVFTRDCVNIGANPAKDRSHIANERFEQGMADKCNNIGVEKQQDRNRIEQRTLGAFIIQKSKKTQRSRRGRGKKTKRKRRKVKPKKKRAKR